MFARAADSTVIERPDADDHRSFVAKGGGFCCKSWHVHFVHLRLISGCSNSIVLEHEDNAERAVRAALAIVSLLTELLIVPSFLPGWRAISAAT
jgi:hypothetical protein